MEKVLVNLYVPCMGEKYDVNIPTFLTIEDITSMLVKAIDNISVGESSLSDFCLLCYQEQNCVLQKDKTLREYAVNDGDQLILI